MLRPVFGSQGDTIIVSQGDTVSIEEDYLTLNNDFKIYPNPTTNIIYFSKVGPIQKPKTYRLEMVNIYGEIIISTNMASLNGKLNVSKFQNGIYLIRFINDENNLVTTKKIIISK